ncbi:flavin oxidoreductase [Actibacterium mucosum KCTC 23349]|uniref:Flavin oxidoreductase n=1 Tax=Actibacterium mucosum KCTC 23349 TaxID=1454373 RepID=A0A037ZK17_9RHOB|nr:flavin oxidoreductase [Actibacterium mucosum KCTC 23349]
MQDFTPNADNTRAFRSALGRFGTGITVVTAPSADGPVGVTANSFSSVSMDPPLVLWSPSKSSRRAAYFTRSSHFAIHVLSQDQADIGNGFAKNAFAFDGLDWRPGQGDVPLIKGCLARFECSRHAIHDGGDHHIMVGRVDRVTTADGSDPLLFFCGQYGRFQAAG